MWSPRRLILIFFGLVLFSGGFTLYTKLFGWIDGLPPIPESYMTEQSGVREVPDLPSAVGPLQTRLRLAFGRDCVEQSQTYKLKFESREKGLLFAAADSRIMEDGRVLVLQVSVAVFGKSNKDDITTIHADRAYLTYDEPVRKIDDIGSRKVKAAELIADPEAQTNDPRKGKIHLINNRKTVPTDDDVIVLTTGPLHYVDEPPPAKPHIWTDAFVELTDRQMRPLPTQRESQLQMPTVTGDGLRVFLTASPKGTAAPPPQPQAKSAGPGGNVTGVERIELSRNVFMNLWTESRNMFGGDAPPTPKKDPGKPAEKVLVTVQTAGPFHYDLIRDLAHFEIPANQAADVQEYVKVVRHSKGNLEDTLTCDYLDVQFSRRSKPDGKLAGGRIEPAAKPPEPKAKGDKADSSGGMEVETLHAWGKNIALSSDEDSLFAYGNDLLYDARIKQTLLKGAPMHAVKSGNLIRSPELLLANLDDKEKQHARARGPGVVGMGEIDPKTQEHARQAHWQEWLVVTKVKEQGRDLDLITLLGQARFSDTLNTQQLNARQIRLWMLPKEGGPAKKEPVAGNPAPGRREEGKQLPHRLEAAGDVSCASADLVINRSEYMNIWFKDLAPPPAVGGQAPPAPAEQPAQRIQIGQPPRPADPLNAGPKAAKKDEPEKKGPPLVVRHARRIEAWINRIESRNELDKVHTEGNVIIHQDPSPGNDRGVDVAGHTVDLQHFAEGDYLVVEGNERVLGEVHFDKISIVADDIRIDQRDNTAGVKGPGSMRLLSKTSLDGAELKEPTHVDIFWNEGMELDGPIRSVRYEGAVQAKQEERKVLCETMQVWLDRPVYLNQTAKPKKNPAARKGDESPKVERVLCDHVPSNGKAKKPRPVTADERELVAGKLVKYQQVLGMQIEMDNQQNKMTTQGPGTVRIFQPGGGDPLAQPAAPAANAKNPKAKKDEETKLTWVKFDQQMIAYNGMPKRAIFHSNSELVHMPAKSHDVEIDITKLPEGAFYLKCEKSLEVTTLSRKVLDRTGKEVEVKWQEMKAEGNVKVQSDDYHGWAMTLTYSEDKSLLVFTGTRSNPAVLNRAEVRGGERKTFRGEKITYNTKTKDFGIDGAVGGSSN